MSDGTNADRNLFYSDYHLATPGGPTILVDSVQHYLEQFSTAEVSNAWTELKGTEQQAIAAMQTPGHNEPISLLRKAAQFLDTRFHFYGRKKSKNQIMEWPRTDNFDRDGNRFPVRSPQGVPAPETEIPRQLKEAEAMVVAMILGDARSHLLQPDVAGDIKDLNLQGDVSISYNTEPGAWFVGQRLPLVELTLRSIGEIRTMSKERTPYQK